MRNLDKKTKSLYFFIFITLVPLLGVIIIFSYAFLHTKEDTDFLSHELRGIKVISQIERTIFDIQKLRGLGSLKTPNEKSIENLKFLKKKIFSDLDLLKKLHSSLRTICHLRMSYCNILIR